MFKIASAIWICAIKYIILRIVLIPIMKCNWGLRNWIRTIPTPGCRGYKFEAPYSWYWANYLANGWGYIVLIDVDGKVRY